MMGSWWVRGGLGCLLWGGLGCEMSFVGRVRVQTVTSMHGSNKKIML